MLSACYRSAYPIATQWVHLADLPVKTRAKEKEIISPTSDELNQLTHTIAQHIARFLERQGVLEPNAECSTLALDTVDEDPMSPLLGHSITYRIAVGPQQGRKVFTLQALPACDADDLFARHGGPGGWVLTACRRGCQSPGNGTNWNVCAATSPDRRYRRNACH